MRAVAYCRVSTNKDEQLDSMEAQQKFFTEYAKKNEYNLVCIYADEGKSGTKMKNRTQLLRLLSDANRGIFDVVLIKDVSRLARNTVDFLTSIRKLKGLGIRVVFVNYDQTSSDSSEFMLTMLSAIAQEESANTSKRIKFGKRINAEKGRVPNFVFGYDKTIGDYFSLTVNPSEAEVVQSIYDMYTERECGTNRIALHLNRDGIKTKRGYAWTTNAVARILTNELYTGWVINGKQEVEDFLTGKRRENDEESWQRIHRPELRIVSDETFERAQRILSRRQEAFKITGERNSEKYVFSKLIKCACCGASFRRSVRTYKNTYVKWLCSGRNANGTTSCPNKTTLNENELLEAIRQYLIGVLREKPQVVQSIVTEFKRQYKAKDENQASEQELMAELKKHEKSRQKYLEMYENDVITMEKLKSKTKELNLALSSIEADLKLVRGHISKSDLLENALLETFKDLEGIMKTEHITNRMLSRILEKIEVDESGHIDVYLRLLSDIGLENTVLISDDHT